MADERIDLPQGTLDLLILKTLALEPQHGWAISERIEQISSSVLQVQQGSLYRLSIVSSAAVGSKLIGEFLRTIAEPNITR